MLVELISRKTVFQKCPRLAEHVMSYQQAMYDPSEDILLEGQEVFLDLDDDTPTTLTKEQADQLNSEHAAYCAAMRDDFEELPTESNFFKRIIAELNVSSFDRLVSNFGESLNRLSTALEWDNVIVISHALIPYLAQENSYMPVKEAIRNLNKMGITQSSTQGVVLNKLTNIDFFTSMFWVVRCNASAPIICFSAANSNIIGTLCKRGNIHFDCYDESETKSLKNALKKANFIEAPDAICVEQFSESSAIEGRQFIID